MSAADAISEYRLGGEPVPADLRILLAHYEEFERRTGVSIPRDRNWTPWTQFARVVGLQFQVRDELPELLDLLTQNVDPLLALFVHDAPSRTTSRCETPASLRRKNQPELSKPDNTRRVARRAEEQ